MQTNPQSKQICAKDRGYFESVENDRDSIAFNLGSTAAVNHYTVSQLLGTIIRVQFSSFQQKAKARGLHRRNMKSRFYAEFLVISVRHSMTKA